MAMNGNTGERKLWNEIGADRTAPGQSYASFREELRNRCLHELGARRRHRLARQLSALAAAGLLFAVSFSSFTTSRPEAERKGIARITPAHRSLVIHTAPAWPGLRAHPIPLGTATNGRKSSWKVRRFAVARTRSDRSVTRVSTRLGHGPRKISDGQLLALFGNGECALIRSDLEETRLFFFDEGARLRFFGAQP